MVTISLDALVPGSGWATSEFGHRISAGEARRLACNAGIIPLVLGGDSMPLDVGREQRLFDPLPEARDQPPARRLRRRRLRPTAGLGGVPPPRALVPGRAHRRRHRDLPLCPPHHQMADHPETWHSTRLPNGKIRFHKRQ